MRQVRFALAPATLLLLAGAGMAAPPAGPQVGDPIAPYTPARPIGVQGKLTCQTC